MGDQIDELIEEIVVDAYGDYEQLCSFRQAFEDDARFPFRGLVVGAEVEVTAVDFDGHDRRGLIAVCQGTGDRHTVSLLEVTPTGPMPLETRQPEPVLATDPVTRRRAPSRAARVGPSGREGRRPRWPRPTPSRRRRG